MKAFFNSTVGKGLAVAYAFFIHGLFALGAYYFGSFVATLIFPESLLLPFIVGVGYAIMVFIGCMWMFFFGEYTFEDLDYFKRETGKDFIWCFWVALVCLAGMEGSSLAFRAYNTPQMVPRIIIIAFGLLALVLAFVLGKIVHVMANRSGALTGRRSREDAARTYYERSSKVTKDMTAAELYAYSQGDAEAVNAAEQRTRDKQVQKDLREWEKQQSKQVREDMKREREAAKQRKFEEDQSFFGKVFHRPKPKADPNFQEAQMNDQASHLSNGNHR